MRVTVAQQQNLAPCGVGPGQNVCVRAHSATRSIPASGVLPAEHSQMCLIL